MEQKVRRRTEEMHKVVLYLFFIATNNKGKKERTLREISRATRLAYHTVWGIVQRLYEDECIELNRYSYVFSEANSFSPHAVVSVRDKKYEWEILEKLRWLNSPRKK